MRVLMDKAHAREFLEAVSYYKSAINVANQLALENDDKAWLEAIDDCDTIEQYMFILVKHAINEAGTRMIERVPDPKVPGGLEFLNFGQDERSMKLYQACRTAEDFSAAPRPLITPELAPCGESFGERSLARKMWAERYRVRRRQFIETLDFVRVGR